MGGSVEVTHRVLRVDAAGVDVPDSDRSVGGKDDPREHGVEDTSADLVAGGDEVTCKWGGG